MVVLSPLLIDAPKSGLAWGPFSLIRVDTDITNPLLRGKMVHFEDVGEGWVFFKYVKLLYFATAVIFSVIRIVNVKKLLKVVHLWMTMDFNLVPGFVL